MPINKHRAHQWKIDVARSVDMYNEWFMRFAPQAFRETRIKTTKEVETALHWTDNLRGLTEDALFAHPEILPTLRMSTCPPLAVDRLIGLSGVAPNLVKCMENECKLPPQMSSEVTRSGLERLATILREMADPDIFVWLDSKTVPSDAQVFRAASIVADRLCGAVANPIIRNAQEKRQLALIKTWLEARGYKYVTGAVELKSMKPGTFSFRMNVPVKLNRGAKRINIPIDAVIMRS